MKYLFVKIHEILLFNRFRKQFISRQIIDENVKLGFWITDALKLNYVFTFKMYIDSQMIMIL